MTWIYRPAHSEKSASLAARGVVSSPPADSAGLRSAMSSETLIANKSSKLASETVTLTTPRSGTTVPRSTVAPGEVDAMSSLPDSPASRSRSLDQAEPQKTNAMDGPTPFASFAMWDQATHSWRTSQVCLLPHMGTLVRFSGIWPNRGTMRDGKCYPLPMWGLRISARGCGWLPTPLVHDASNNGAKGQHNRNTPPLNAVVDGRLSPDWVEWIMGWPIGWTRLDPLPASRWHEWAAPMAAPWEQCPCCDNFLCNIHHMHAHGCDCPPAHEWTRDPYSPPGSWWATEHDLPRITTERSHRVSRLKAIGNGQVPACAASAWRSLS